ncbi:hypothetical protein, partial [Intestinimonas timonensis]|uniref:hypothetical protein n=1 Tax=Intestinimonas timonensis TaxID=1689270 RepID=UPI001A916002
SASRRSQGGQGQAPAPGTLAHGGGLYGGARPAWSRPGPRRRRVLIMGGHRPAMLRPPLRPPCRYLSLHGRGR